MEQTSSVNWVDLCVVLTILFSAGLAFMRGLVREVFSLAAWIGSVYVSVWLYPHMQGAMHGHFSSEKVANAAAGFSSFTIALVSLMIAGHYVAGLIRGDALTAIDRSLGFAFGFFRGLIVVSLIFMAVMWTWPDPEKQPMIVKTAKTRPMLVAGEQMIRNVTPASIEKIMGHVRTAEEGRQQAEEQNKDASQLSAPEPAISHDENQPSYDDGEREKMDNLIRNQN